MPSDMVNRLLEQNLNLLPKETFTYDEMPSIESTLDLVKFYNDLEVGIQLDRFNNEKRFKPFVAVATYH
jgi:hypothetical protein